jgi:protein-tyrosine-phosphatase
MMAEVLQMYLHNARKTNIMCESAGVLEIAAQGKGASIFLLEAGSRIGLNFEAHRSRWIENLILSQYDLIVCVDDIVAGQVIRLGANYAKVCNAGVPNSWPVHHQSEYDVTAAQIMAAMYKIITRYIPADSK